MSSPNAGGHQIAWCVCPPALKCTGVTLVGSLTKTSFLEAPMDAVQQTRATDYLFNPSQLPAAHRTALSKPPRSRHPPALTFVSGGQTPTASCRVCVGM